jgi:ATP-dependent Clp protease adaptor protein ClpS
MAETITSPGTRIIEETGEKLDPPFHLILLDDDHHTYQYVILMLGMLFGYARDKAFAIACIVDKHGQAILMTGGREAVERKQNEIHSFGADPFMPSSKGSMSAIIEPAA